MSLLSLIFIQVIGTSLPENEVFPTWDEQVHNGLPTDKSNKKEDLPFFNKHFRIFLETNMYRIRLQFINRY